MKPAKLTILALILMILTPRSFANRVGFDFTWQVTDVTGAADFGYRVGDIYTGDMSYDSVWDGVPIIGGPIDPLGGLVPSLRIGGNGFDLDVDFLVIPQLAHFSFVTSANSSTLVLGGEYESAEFLGLELVGSKELIVPGGYYLPASMSLSDWESGTVGINFAQFNTQITGVVLFPSVPDQSSTGALFAIVGLLGAFIVLKFPTRAGPVRNGGGFLFFYAAEIRVELLMWRLQRTITCLRNS